MAAGYFNVMRSDPDVCPACKHDKCAPARIDPWVADDPSPSNLLFEGVEYGRTERGTRLRNGARFLCCLQCGLVWNYAEPNEIAAAMKRLGVPEGEVPERVSYAARLLMWIAFIVFAMIAILWLSTVTRN